MKFGTRTSRTKWSKGNSGQFYFFLRMLFGDIADVEGGSGGGLTKDCQSWWPAICTMEARSFNIEKGGDPANWRNTLNLQSFPSPVTPSAASCCNLNSGVHFRFQYPTTRCDSCCYSLELLHFSCLYLRNIASNRTYKLRLNYCSEDSRFAIRILKRDIQEPWKGMQNLILR
jgi:hypothetical protein